MSIPAEVHSDDFVIEAKFDAERWFAHASEAEILRLAEIEWGGDYEADEVARFFDGKPGFEQVSALFNYLSGHPRMLNGDTVGFECHITDPDAALRWIEANRPQMFPARIAYAIGEDEYALAARIRGASPAP